MPSLDVGGSGEGEEADAPTAHCPSPQCGVHTHTHTHTHIVPGASGTSLVHLILVIRKENWGIKREKREVMNEQVSPGKV